MRRIITISIVALLSTNAFGVDLLGIPRAELGQGTFGLGAEIAWSDFDLDLNNSGLTYKLPDRKVPLGSAEAELKSNFNYGTIGYGILPEVDIYLGLGSAKVESDGSNTDNVFGYAGDSDYGFALRGRFNATLARKDKLSLGLIGGFGWTKCDLDGSSYLVTLDLPPDDPWGTPIQRVFWGSIDGEVNLYHAELALGAAYDISPGLAVYGGPMMRWYSGDVDIDVTSQGIGSGDSQDIDDSQFGGFVGLQLMAYDNVSLQAEYQFGEDSVAGVSLLYRCR